MTFHESEMKGYNSDKISLEVASYKVQRAKPHKSLTQEICFASALGLMQVSVCIRFHEGSLKGFRATETANPKDV